MYSAQVLEVQASQISLKRIRAIATHLHFMLKGAMRRTTCCLFFAFFPRGIFDGSKSGGKYLLMTFRCEQGQCQRYAHNQNTAASQTSDMIAQYRDELVTS